MKKFNFIIIISILSLNLYANSSDGVYLKIDYFPKTIKWHIKKEQLGNLINQQILFTPNKYNDYRVKLETLEYLTNEDGKVLPKEMMVGERINKRSLRPFIEKTPEVIVKKSEKKNMSFLRAKTTKEMNGCYFFAYYPRSTIKKDENGEFKAPKKNASINMEFRMISGGFLHVIGTEFYKIQDNLKIKNNKNNLNIKYNFHFDGNCLAMRPRFKIELRKNNKIVFSKNKIMINESADISFYPDSNYVLEKNIPIKKLEKGKYKLKILLYSENEYFQNLFHVINKDIKI